MKCEDLPTPKISTKILIFKKINTINMPVASSAQKEPQLPAGFHQLLRAAHHHSQLSPSAIAQDAASYIPDLATPYPGGAAGAAAAHHQEIHHHRHHNTSSSYFNTSSPPLLNLSPNLSSASDASQRGSPVYDLRESTRRRSNTLGKILVLYLL